MILSDYLNKFIKEKGLFNLIKLIKYLLLLLIFLSIKLLNCYNSNMVKL